MWLEKLPADVCAYIGATWFSAEDMVCLQWVICVPALVMTVMKDVYWTAMPLYVQQLILRSLMNAPPVVHILREHFRYVFQGPLRCHWPIWIKKINLNKQLILFEAMHVIPDTVIDAVVKNEFLYPWLFHHAVVCHLFETGDTSFYPPPRVTKLTIHNVYRNAIAWPSVTNLVVKTHKMDVAVFWPSVRRLIIHENEFDKPGKYALSQFPMLEVLDIERIHAWSEIRGWNTLKKLSRLVYCAVDSLDRGVCAPPNCMIPTLVDMEITQPHWLEYALTVQASVLQTLKACFSDIPEDVLLPRCPCLTKVTLSISNPDVSDIEVWQRWLPVLQPVTELYLSFTSSFLKPPSEPLKWPATLRGVTTDLMGNSLEVWKQWLPRINV